VAKYSTGKGMGLKRHPENRNESPVTCHQWLPDPPHIGPIIFRDTVKCLHNDSGVGQLSPVQHPAERALPSRGRRYDYHLNTTYLSYHNHLHQFGILLSLSVSQEDTGEV
jgi:hypothetical protein